MLSAMGGKPTPPPLGMYQRERGAGEAGGYKGPQSAHEPPRVGEETPMMRAVREREERVKRERKDEAANALRVANEREKEVQAHNNRLNAITDKLKQKEQQLRQIEVDKAMR